MICNFLTFTNMRVYNFVSILFTIVFCVCLARIFIWSCRPFATTYCRLASTWLGFAILYTFGRTCIVSRFSVSITLWKKIGILKYKCNYKQLYNNNENINMILTWNLQSTWVCCCCLGQLLSSLYPWFQSLHSLV